MRLICVGCGIPLDPIPGKVKRSCPSCGVWTDYRHLIGEKEGAAAKAPAPNSPPPPPFFEQPPDSPPRLENSSQVSTGDAILDQLMEPLSPGREGGSKSEPQTSGPINPTGDGSKASLLVQPQRAVEEYSSSEDPEDSLPYAITDSGEILCPKCHQKLPADSVLCVQCGLNFQTGERVRRTHKVVNHHWVETMAPHTRKMLAFLWSGSVLVTLFALWQFESLSLGGLIGWSIFGVPQVLLLLGSYGELTLTRNRKGQVRITRKFHIGFVNLAEAHHLPEGHEGVKCSVRSSMGFFEWVVMVLLLVPTIVPGVVFYFLVMHRPYVVIALTRHSGRQESILFRTRDENQGREIAQTIHKITGKPLDFAA